MDNIWVKWSEHYKQLGIDPKEISKDGIVDPAQYEKANPKVLFVLKETNNYRDDLRALLRSNPWRTIALWSATILDQNREYKDSEKLDTKSLSEYLSRVAVINLKKTTGGSKADMNEINVYAHQDRELLREQIRSIKPSLILACGVEMMLPLLWLLDLKVTSDNTKLAKPINDEKSGVWVIPWKHPTRANNQKTCAELKKLLSTLC